MITCPPRHGKALALDTPIATPSGWTTMGQISPGDQVFDETGNPCSVVAVSPLWKDRPCYRFVTDDGDEIVADADHEWLVRTDRKSGKRVIRSSRVLAEQALRRTARAPLVDRAAAIVCAENDNLPIEPYVLGVWLGDGCSGHATITASDEDAVFTRAEIEARGYATGNRATAQTFGIFGLFVALRKVGLLRNKHVPEAYLRASAKQRLALLQGLVDTDGHVAPDGQVEYCSINLKLALAAQELVRSLGTKAKIIVGRAMLNGKDCGLKYRVMFYMADAALMPRKAARCRNGVKQPVTYLQQIEAVEPRDTVCIQVDSASHLFLAGLSMTPTHNSEMVSRRFPPWYLGRNPKNQIISASYGQRFANGFGRETRNIIASTEYQRIFDTQIAHDSAATDRYHTTDGGIYIAAGVGGSITGLGAHVLSIDDPLKNREEADSETIRDNVWDWYTSTAYTRLMPRGAVIITLTRWHPDDLAGRLLDAEKTGGDQWTKVNLPAINDANEALWPEWYPLPALERIRSNIGDRDFAALYQQQPNASRRRAVQGRQDHGAGR